MPHPLRDYHVTILDAAGNPITAANPLDTTGGGTNPSATDKETFSEGVTAFTPAGGVYDDTLAALATGKLAVARITPRRATHVNLRSDDGSEIGINQEIVLATSAARTTTFVGTDQTNLYHRGVMVFLRITAAPSPATGFLRLSIQARDPVATTTYSALNARSTQVTVNAVGAFMWVLYPGASGDVFTANSSGVKDIIAFPLPKIWRVVVVHSNAESYTYSVAAAMIL